MFLKTWFCYYHLNVRNLLLILGWKSIYLKMWMIRRYGKNHDLEMKVSFYLSTLSLQFRNFYMEF
jgi:hypothetical protein